MTLTANGQEFIKTYIKAFILLPSLLPQVNYTTELFHLMLKLTSDTIMPMPSVTYFLSVLKIKLFSCYFRKTKVKYLTHNLSQFWEMFQVHSKSIGKKFDLNHMHSQFFSFIPDHNQLSQNICAWAAASADLLLKRNTSTSKSC